MEGKLKREKIGKIDEERVVSHAGHPKKSTLPIDEETETLWICTTTPNCTGFSF